jgi:hypothetical protein
VAAILEGVELLPKLADYFRSTRVGWHGFEPFNFLFEVVATTNRLHKRLLFVVATSLAYVLRSATQAFSSRFGGTAIFFPIQTISLSQFGHLACRRFVSRQSKHTQFSLLIEPNSAPIARITASTPERTPPTTRFAACGISLESRRHYFRQSVIKRFTANQIGRSTRRLIPERMCLPRSPRQKSIAPHRRACTIALPQFCFHQRIRSLILWEQ